MVVLVDHHQFSSANQTRSGRRMLLLPPEVGPLSPLLDLPGVLFSASLSLAIIHLAGDWSESLSHEHKIAPSSHFIHNAYRL